MSLENKSVLVTGGAGFIGSHLVDRLIKEKPANLVIVDNFFLGKESNLQEAKKNFPTLKIFNIDASNEEKMGSLVKKENTEVLFNLAIVPLPASLVNPRWVYEHNISITLGLCELARKGCYQTLIHFSSSEAYGTCQYVPMDEGHPLNPTTSYGASKAATDHLVLSYHKSFGIDAAIIRPFNNYGPRQNEGNYAGVIPLTIKRILSGEGPVIYGDGEQTRDYLYVTETVDAAIRVYNCASTRGKALNIASGTEISINNLVRLIAKCLGCDRPITYEKERPGDVRRLVAGIALAKSLIGFKPVLHLNEKLQSTIEWFQKEKLT